MTIHDGKYLIQIVVTIRLYERITFYELKFTMYIWFYRLNTINTRTSKNSYIDVFGAYVCAYFDDSNLPGQYVISRKRELRL